MNQPDEMEVKRRWTSSMPYPEWPFGAVKPRELAKWARKNAQEKKLYDDEYEEAPF